MFLQFSQKVTQKLLQNSTSCLKVAEQVMYSPATGPNKESINSPRVFYDDY